MHGLPSRLPAGERVLWQGSPAWRMMIGSVFHLRMVAAYFALIILWCTASSLRDGGPLTATAMSMAKMTGAALVPIGVMALYAWMAGRSTIYTITNRRVVVHAGVAFPMSVNIPFARIASAALTVRADGSGDIPLQLNAGEKLGYFVMWPNVRPWRMARAEPMLRCVPDAAAVAQTLSRALAGAADAPVSLQPVADRASGVTVGLSAIAAA